MSLTQKQLTLYLQKQLDNNFPDNKVYSQLNDIVLKAIQKIKFNFKNIQLSYFFKNNQVYFNHLNADQYTIFIYYASNIAYESFNNIELASKLFYLNKAMHNFHCMYDTKLPDIFLVIHGSGIVLGKAKYSNFLVIMHGVTVGSNSKWESPILGERIVMYPYSSILGMSVVERNTCLSNGSLLADCDTDAGTLVIGRSPNIIIKKQSKCKSEIYFKNHE